MQPPIDKDNKIPITFRLLANMNFRTTTFAILTFRIAYIFLLFTKEVSPLITVFSESFRMERTTRKATSANEISRNTKPNTTASFETKNSTVFSPSANVWSATERPFPAPLIPFPPNTPLNFWYIRLKTPFPKRHPNGYPMKNNVQSSKSKVPPICASLIPNVCNIPYSEVLFDTEILNTL